MVKRKVKIPNVIRGGIAVPLGNNYYFMKGRKHINGGIDIGRNPRTGIEVEDGEVMKMENDGAKIFSSVPFLNGKSPAQRVMQGENPNDVFKHQEMFKRKNNINNDGTNRVGENTTWGNASAQEEFEDGGNTNKGIKFDKDALHKGAPNVINGEKGLQAVYPEFQLLSAVKNLTNVPYIFRTIDTIIRKPNKKGKFDFGKGIDSQEGAKEHLKKSFRDFGIDLINPLFKIGGHAKWRSSNKVRSRIAKMEGSSMKTNRSFDLEDRDFYNAMPKEVRENLSQDALDNLYSYSYNVGAGAFKRRVVPSLIDLTRGKIGADSVAKVMTASKDTKLRGLKLRRQIERSGFVNAYNKSQNKQNINYNDNIIPVDNTYVKKPIIINNNTLQNKNQSLTENQQNNNNDYVKQYHQYIINKSIELMKPKTRYNSTFALGGRINTSTGDYSRNKYGWGSKVLDRTVFRQNVPSRKDYSNIKFTTQNDINDDIQDRNVLDNIVATNKQNIINQQKEDAIRQLNNKIFNDLGFDRESAMKRANDRLYAVGGKVKKKLNKLFRDTYDEQIKKNLKDKSELPLIDNEIKRGSAFRKMLKTNLATVPSLNPGLSTKINDKYIKTKKNEFAKNNTINNNQNNKLKFTTNDYIGLGANTFGSIASAIINGRMLNKMKYFEAPTRMTAAKLKTNYNINPELDAIRENNYNIDSSIDANTGSSQVALARKQRNRLLSISATNNLYGQKENQETQLINQDRLNQQGIANQNIQAYNTWQQGKNAFENNIAEKRAENYINGLQNLNTGVQDILSRQEQRAHDNNTIRAMLAANPNVKPELFRHYGLNLYRFGGYRYNR